MNFVPHTGYCLQIKASDILIVSYIQGLFLLHLGGFNPSRLLFN